MASTQSHSSNSPGGYKRASRKGAPRRFVCEHAGCDKIYSRAEHLQRHQLNRKCSGHISNDGLLTVPLQTTPKRSSDVTYQSAIRSLCALICLRDTRSATLHHIRPGTGYPALALLNNGQRDRQMRVCQPKCGHVPLLCHTTRHLPEDLTTQRFY